MREIGGMSFLSNLRPLAAFQRTREAAAASEEVEGVDPLALQRHMQAAQGLGTRDVLAQYDLRDINREELTALTNILHDRNEISDRQFNNLFAQAALAFADSNTEKGDFLGYLEQGLQNFQTTGNARQDGMRLDVITRAVNTVQSIDRAKSSGADRVAISSRV